MLNQEAISKMPSYKLTYFNLRGRAEITRLVFAAAGTKYEDKRITKEEWADMKEKMPQGQMPILEVDGFILPQSLAIARFAAKEVGLMGGTNLEQVQVDMVLQTWEDFRRHLYTAMREQDKTKKAELTKKNIEEVLPKYLGIFQTILESNNGGNGFFIGKSVTVADLAVMDVLEIEIERNPNLLDEFPKLKANRQRVAELPKVKAWLESRPKTAF